MTKVYLYPGVNLRSVGTVRDAQKWPKRDIRKDPNKLDLIHFKLLSPYTVQKMLRGVEVLNTLQKTSGATSNFYSYQSAKIKNSSLNHGLILYKLAINKFLGNTLISKIEHTQFKSFDELIQKLKPESPYGTGEWLDLAGLFAPKSLVEKLLEEIESGTIDSLDAINQSFLTMYQQYAAYEWTWTMDIICKWWGKKCDTITLADIIGMIETWKKSVVDLDKMLYEDAKKEFTLIAKTGFGVDGDEEDKHRDFEMVRGEFEKNIFVSSIREHIAHKSAICDGMIERLKALPAG
jgi:hypothetical protein